MEPLPKVARRRRRLTQQEKLFRSALGVLRYSAGDWRAGPTPPRGERPWLSVEAVLCELRQRSAAGRSHAELLTPQNVRAVLELDPTRVEMFSWRHCTWARAKARPPLLGGGGPGLASPAPPPGLVVRPPPGLTAA